METLNQDIKSGDFKRFYLLFGEEEFLKQSYKKRLRQAVAGDDTMNYNYCNAPYTEKIGRASV